MFKMWLVDDATGADLKKVYSTPINVAIPELSNKSEKLEKVGRVAKIEISGPITEDRDPVLTFFGVKHSSYNELAASISAANEDPTVDSIDLLINSGGGTFAGFSTGFAAISESKKKTRAIVRSAQSAAYGLASAANEILAKDDASMFGSIGVAMDLRKDSEKISITSDGAPNKRPDLETEEGKAEVRSLLNSMHENFVGKISKGRGISAEKVDLDFGKGSTFLAADAISRGMADGYIVPDKLATKGTKKMDIQQLKAEHPALFTEICGQALTAERERVAAHVKMGESSGDMETALKAIAAGDSLTELHLATYMSATLDKRNQQTRIDGEESLKSATENLEQKPKDKENENLDPVYVKSFAETLAALRGIEV